MKWILFVTLLLISCPKPGIVRVPEPDYLREAQRCYRNRPLYAYNILNNFVAKDAHTLERAKTLIKLYIEQREYERAAALLDSIDWSANLTQYEINTILLKTERWNMLISMTQDDLLKGIAFYHLNRYPQAIEFLSKPAQPDDYRMLYLAKTYKDSNDLETALETIMATDSISSYLEPEYQDLLFNILSQYEDFTMVRKELEKLKESHLKEFVLLNMYKKKKDRKNLTATAWKLVREYPKSEGAYYSLRLIEPKSQTEHKLFGKVYYYHRDYNRAIKHLEKAPVDNQVSYYLGKTYYEKGSYSKALNHLARCTWAAAHYYRGRIYEKLDDFSKAIAVYDSLYTSHKGSNYATRGFKRKAFLLEDIGDTLKAVETFLKIAEVNTKFRAAMQLFRIGKLNKADSILMISYDPEFIYWRTRIKERLGKPTEGFRNYLTNTYPLSYYTLVRSDKELVFDTTSLETWMNQLGDSSVSFNKNDSLHLENAARYFNLNETNYGIEELGMIKDKNPQDLLYLSKFCARYGADKHSIIYSLRIKELAKKNNLLELPFDLYRLIYPVRYVCSIKDQKVELSLCLAMIWQESLFNPLALSPANARGIMQIIPRTAKIIASDLKVQDYSLNDPVVSIRFGCHYFSKLLNDFNSIPLSLAGYNAGPVRVKRWIKQDPNCEIDEFIDLIPYNETRNYVKSILSRQIIYKNLLGV